MPRVKIGPALPDGLPVTDMYLGLHVGGMFCGNVGSTERLTVVGRPSTRPAGSPPVEQPVLVSEAFANVDGMRGRLVSVGEAFPWETAPAYLVRDNDAAYGPVFKRRVRAMGIRDRPTSPRSCPSRKLYPRVAMMQS